MNRPHLLAIDAGTGSCRAVLFDTDGHQVAVRAREWFHAPVPGVPGGLEFDAARNWQAIAECVRELLAAVDDVDVLAVSSTGMREGIVLYDADGSELWACPNVDSRAGDEADRLVADGTADRIYRIAGDWVSITSPARLRWLAAHRPDVLRRTRGLGMLSDWVLTRLSGEQVTDPSCGSSSGMFDLAARAWSAEVARLCGLDPAVLPRVVEPGTVVGGVTTAAAAATGLRPGTPVVAGGADTQMALLGLAARPGEFTVIGGTFWQATMLTDTPTIDPGTRLRTLCHALPGQWMVEAIGFFSGMSLRWFRDAFCPDVVAAARTRGVDPYALMEERARAVPPGADGTVAVLSGLMNARRWTHATPSFVGLDLGAGPGEGRAACVRAIEEAAAYVVRGHRELVTQVCGVPVDRLVLTAGAARGELWPQIVADAVGVPVEVPAVTESSALGAALCAGRGAGLYDTIDAPLPTLRRRARVREPQPGAAAAYDRLYPRWARVYRAMLELTEAEALTPMWRGAGSGALSDPHSRRDPTHA